MKNLAVLVFVGLILACLCGTDYTKIIHNTDPNAKCLDGSSPMIYLH